MLSLIIKDAVYCVHTMWRCAVGLDLADTGTPSVDLVTKRVEVDLVKKRVEKRKDTGYRVQNPLPPGTVV